MNKTISFLSWIVLALSLIAWAGIVYGSMRMLTLAQERGATAQSAEQKAAKAAYQSRLKSIAAETVPEREKLDSLTGADIVTIANSIEAAGRSVGVGARVSAAIPAGSPQEVPGGGSLQGLAFIVQAEGTFAGLVQLVHVLEAYPGFSSVEQFEFEKVEAAERASQAWRTSIRLQIRTTSDISS